MGVEFRPLTTEEQERLGQALRGNAKRGEALHMSPRDTRFLATGEADESIEHTIAAIRSVPVHYADDRLVQLALEMIRDNGTYREDARQGAPVGNSVIGSLLNLQHKAPRQYTEAAVLEALRLYDAEMAADEAGAEEYRLPRSGLPKLQFTGDLLASSDGERSQGRENNRWHELAIYRTAAGKYVAAIGYRTRWQGELDYDLAEVLSTPAEVVSYFRVYVPTKHVRGYPTGPSYTDKQERLLADIAHRYYAQASEVLAGDEFAEVVS